MGQFLLEYLAREQRPHLQRCQRFIRFVGLAFSGKSCDFVEEDGLIPFPVPCKLPLAFIVTLIIIGFKPMVDHFAPESFAPRVHFSAFIVKSLLMSTT